jgi:diguanylate cyclase (GGDEF)-like protein/PAS domain S-box-containing protein
MSGETEFPASAPPVPAKARPVAIVWVFVGIVICLLGLTVYSARLLSAGHAFIVAESAWSKAQKDAVFHLTRYAQDHTDEDYQAYRKAMSVIEGDRLARTELMKPDSDIEIVRRGFSAGGVHPDDLEGLLTLYRTLRGFGPMEYVMTVWSRSDPAMRELNDIGRTLHDAGGAVGPQADEFVRRIARINRSLAPLEKDFAETLDEMERTAQSLLATALLVITAILLIAGITLSRRFLIQNERLQEALSQSEAQLRHVIETAPMPLLIARAADQKLLYLNGKALVQLGMDFEAALKHSFSDLHADPAIRSALGEQLSREGMVDDFEVHLKAADGRQSWLLMSAQPVRYAGVVCLLIALANIDDRKRLQEDMRRRALHDPLTTLANRAMFLESLERAVHKARRRSAQFSVLFVDLDRFKEVNDTMGHAAGDALLKTVAERLVSAVRQSDLVARLGGDEFVILIEEHGGPEEVMIVAQKVLAMVERPVPVDWREATVSASIGIATFPEDGEDAEALLRNADAAMYQSKERGRNNFQFYSPELNVISHRRLEQEKRVREALEREEFFLEYQPEIDLATGRMVAVEALLRWQDPVAGVVTPPEFMPLAEESGTIGAIGAWVLERALSDAGTWRDEGVPLVVSVNISARELQQAELIEEVRAALEKHALPLKTLRMEIAEPVLTEGDDGIHRALRNLKAIGVEIAIDNFGTGLSSLGLVRGLPIEVVKIDRSLVSACPVKRECAAIVQATASMARSLGLRVVAEGVETEEQRAQMAALGCDGAQGHFFAEPSDARRITELARARAKQPDFA